MHMCGGTGGWRRVVYLNITEPTSTCPSGWNITGYSKRTCGKASDVSRSCDSAIFPVYGGQYSSVCGRIKAYQWGSTDAFWYYHDGHATTIDEDYVDGVSLTHGSPRQHIWTIAAGATEIQPTSKKVCPCDANINIMVPAFVGEDYFCESANEEYESHNILYSDDPLWDGENCRSSSTCCTFNSPPYFVKHLPAPTSDDIEVRICLSGADDENVAVEEVELYVR